MNFVKRVTILFRWMAMAAFFVVVANHAPAQVAQSALPTVIDSCFYYPAPSKDRLCQSWLRTGDRYEVIGGGMGVASPQRFDKSDAVFVQSGAGTRTYSGKITGNQIQGTVSFGPAEYATTYKWSGRFFYPPSGDPATGHHVYAASDDKVSIINTANHAVSNVNLNDAGKSFGTAGAIVVSAGSSRAWVGTEDPQWKAAIFALDGEKGTITRIFPLQNTPIPSGAISLAVSGDGSTLYAVGTGKGGPAIIALDAVSGAVKFTQPIPKGYKGGEQVFNPRLVISGSNLVLDDGTIVDTPAGGPAIFGSDSHGLVAFSDGKRVCSLSTIETRGNTTVLGKPGVVMIGTKAIERRQGCVAISPDGSKTYSDAQLRSEEGTAATNPNFGAVMSVLGSWTGLTPDGKTIYTLRGPVVYTIDTATNLTTDAIRVCEGAHLLGLEPYTR